MKNIFENPSVFADIAANIDSNFLAVANSLHRFAYPTHTVKGFAINEPDEAPTTGDAYIVGAAGTAWGLSVVANDVIYWNGTAWAKSPTNLADIQSLMVKKAGNETIGGVKTFISAPIVPDATAAQHPVTLNQLESIAFDTIIHPPSRDTQEFTSVLGAGWWTDKDNWFDGNSRKFIALNVRSYANSTIVVAFFKVNGSVAEKIAEKNVNVTIGVNNLSLSQIIDNQSVIVPGEKYFIFCRNLSSCIRFYINSVNNNAYYIDTTNEAVALVRSYDFSFWLTTKDSIILTTEEKRYLNRQSVSVFDLATEIGSNEYVFIPPGIHNLNNKLNFRSNQKIEGIPGKSIIRFTNSALTICAEAINISNVTIQGVTFEHTDADVPLIGNDVSDGVIDDFAGAIGLSGNGTHVGLHVYNCRSINIIDCTFRNFNSYGIWLRGAGADYFNSSALQNINAYNCYIGINVTNEGEYISFNGLKLNRNQIGMVMNAGNNTVVNSHIDGNRVGLLLLNAANGAHGSFGSCTFNHNSLYGVASNLVALGESFSNCQHWHGDIYVKDSKGLVFSACVFGSTDIFADGNFSGGGMWMISNSVFREGTITVNHNYNGNTSNLILKNNHFSNASSAVFINN